MRQAPVKITDLKRKKELNEKISMLTCYDYPSARIISESSLDCVLVGDSVAMAVHGYESTVMATIDMMELHTKAVARGIGRQLILSDLPFLAHRKSQADTVHNVSRLMQAGAHAIKIEGGDDDTCKTIAYLTASGIAVSGHIGLTPQSVHQLGGYKIQGRDEKDAARLLTEAKKLEDAGCSLLVLECVPASLAENITRSLSIPTVGIGAGSHTDGQVLVWHDMLGLHDFKAKFLRSYAHLKSGILEAVQNYVNEVGEIQFPAPEHSF